MDDEQHAFMERIISTRRCIVCGGTLHGCYQVHPVVRGRSHVQECHGLEKDGFGYSVRKSPIQQFLCTSCGYMMAFVRTPEMFAQDKL